MNHAQTLFILARLCLSLLILPASNQNPVVPEERGYFGVPWLSADNNIQKPEVKQLYQGDILLPDHVSGQFKNALKIEARKWHRGVIPYYMTNSFNIEDRTKILSAMRRIGTETCVKFVPRRRERTYVFIDSKEEGCYATIGYFRYTQGLAKVNLQRSACTHQGTIEHELLHVIGLLHEQSRTDRDDYVEILWENIKEENFNNFVKASDMEVSAYGVPYNYKSVMHYPADAFSKNGKLTIVAKKDPTITLGQIVAATEEDLEKVRRMYCQESQ